MTSHFGIVSGLTNVQPFVATPILSPCTKFCRAKEIQILLSRKGRRMCGTCAWPLNPSVKLPVVVGLTIQVCLEHLWKRRGSFSWNAQFRPNPGFLFMMVSGHRIWIRSNGQVYRGWDPQGHKQGPMFYIKIFHLFVVVKKDSFNHSASCIMTWSRQICALVMCIFCIIPIYIHTYYIAIQIVSSIMHYISVYTHM